MNKGYKKLRQTINELASAGYRLQKIAGGADIRSGDMQFACAEGMFSEEIAGQQIKGLLKEVQRLREEVNEHLIGRGRPPKYLPGEGGLIR